MSSFAILSNVISPFSIKLAQFTFHNFIVLFNLLESSVELVKFFLSFKHSFKLLISFLFLAFILALQDLILALSFHSISLDNVVVVVSALKGCLHTSKLMLYAVKLNTSFLSRLSNFPDFFLFLSKLQINTLVLIGELLSQSVLQPCHQGLYKE